MTRPPDDTQRFDEYACAGYRLRASLGPTRWRLGDPFADGSFANDFAYAPDGESIWATFRHATGGAFVHLDLDGGLLGDPHHVPGADRLTLSASGTRAAFMVDGRTLVVLDLPTMRERLRVAAPPLPPRLSDDGSLVAVQHTIRRIDTGAILAEVNGLAALSPTGEYAFTVESSRCDSLVTLLRVGGGQIRSARCDARYGLRCAWSADGEHVAWIARGEVFIWGLRDASQTSIKVPSAGRMAWVERGAGRYLLVGSPSGLVALAPDGRVESLTDLEVSALHAVTPDGHRALVSRGAELGEIDLASRSWRSRSPAHAAVVRHVAWNADGRTAVLARANGDLRVWDVEGWRTERVIRSGAPAAWTATWIGTDAFVVTDETAEVHLYERSGRLVWSHALAPLDAWGTDWKWAGCRVAEEGGALSTSAVWTRGPHTEPDGVASFEYRGTITVLRPTDGAVLSETNDPDADALPPSGPLPRVYIALSRERSVRVDGEVMRFDRLLGDPRQVHPSPDGSILLVATGSGQLLRFDRV